MENQTQIECTNGIKSLNCTNKIISSTSNLNDDPLTTSNVIPIYSTRKSSRRLNQQLYNGLDNSFNTDQLNTNLNQNNSNLNTLNNNNNLNNNLINQNNNSNLIQNTNLSKDISNINHQILDSSLSPSSHHSNSQNLNSNSITLTSSLTNNALPISISNSNLVLNNSTVIKHQRKWEQWQMDDTKWFFDALNENGKDFNAIHSYMINKLKKKGISEDLMKNKEQIRCYFNRQWNKICSIFECNDQLVKNLDKTTKQLYGLINYGEMWKKYNFKNDLKIDAKFKAHLNELVFKGYTFLKIGKKSKNIKLRTPVCKALKKIYYFETFHRSINQNLPKEIELEFVPASNYAWMKVHSLAQNPKIRVKCSLQKRLVVLITYLENRWNEIKYKEAKLEHLTGEHMVKWSENNQNKKLKIKPHASYHKNLTGLKFTRIQPVPLNTQTDISLSAYLSKAKSKVNNLNELNKQKRKNLNNLNCSKTNKNTTPVKEDLPENFQLKVDVNNEELNYIFTEKSNTSSRVNETVRSLNILNNIVSSNYNQNNSNDNEILKEKNELNVELMTEEKSLHLPNPPPNATIGEWLSANANDENNKDNKIEDKINNKLPDTTSKEEEKKEIISQDNNIYNQMHKVFDSSTIKNGWFVDNTEDLTIGELYLMLKRPCKIIFQYDWHTINNNEACSSEASKLKNCVSSQFATHQTNYSSLISKLITAVTLELMNLKKEKDCSSENETDYITINKNCKTSTRRNKKLKTNEIEINISSHENNSVPDQNICQTTNLSTNNQNKNLSFSTISFNNSNEVDVNNCNEVDQHSNDEKFAIPNNPVSKQSTKQHHNKNRIVNEALLQEAKEQLCNIKFNSRRNFRKPLMKQQQPLQPQQQFQLNLNANQILGNNLRQLLANQGTLATLPVNVSNTNGNTALISVITQVNSSAPNCSTNLQTISIQNNNNIQLDNDSVLGDLCSNISSCVNVEKHNFESGSSSNLIENRNTIDLIGKKSLEKVEENIYNENNKFNEMVNSSSNENLLNLDLSNILNVKSNEQEYDLVDNLNEIKTLNETDKLQDQTVNFGNLLDISLSDTMFNDSLPFTNETSINTNFVSKEDTLNTPIKLSTQSKTPLNQLSSLSPHFGSIFNTSASNESNHIENIKNVTLSEQSNNSQFVSSSFTDSVGWNLNSEISLSNIFDCANDQQSQFKNFDTNTFASKKEEIFETFNSSLLNNDQINLSNSLNENSADLMQNFTNFSKKDEK